jgi:hypothetical protein
MLVKGRGVSYLRYNSAVTVCIAAVAKVAVDRKTGETARRARLRFT